MTAALCKWCHKTFDEHLDSRPAGDPVPRMPCTGLKQYFLAQVDREAVTEPPPADRTTQQEIRLSDSQKLDRALGILTLLSDRVLEIGPKVDANTAELDAIKQHLSGIRGATEDLRPRVEELERLAHTHVNGSTPPGE